MGKGWNRRTLKTWNEAPMPQEQSREPKPQPIQPIPKDFVVVWWSADVGYGYARYADLPRGNHRSEVTFKFHRRDVVTDGVEELRKGVMLRAVPYLRPGVGIYPRTLKDVEIYVEPEPKSDSDFVAIMNRTRGLKAYAS